ncbi:hypothetical protein AB0C44_00845 [Micromonospora taraxaci]
MSTEGTAVAVTVGMVGFQFQQQPLAAQGQRPPRHQLPQRSG